MKARYNIIVSNKGEKLMSTRSLIGKLNEDGSVDYVYCHSDGYLAGVGKTLVDFYGKSNIDRLLALGDLSYLGNNPVSKPELWRELDLSGEYSRSYRDRGDQGAEAKEAASREDFVDKAEGAAAEYAYLLTGSGWEYLEIYGGRDWKKLG